MLDGPVKISKTSLPKPRSSADTMRHHHDHEHHHHDEVGDQLLLGRVDDLAKLGDHLAVEGGDAGALLGAPSARSVDCLAVRHVLHLSSSRSIVRLSLQGTRDLNPQPSVLETDALPVELVPFAVTCEMVHPTCATASRAWLSLWESTKRGVYGVGGGRVQTGLRPRQHPEAARARPPLTRWPGEHAAPLSERPRAELESFRDDPAGGVRRPRRLRPEAGPDPRQAVGRAARPRRRAAHAADDDHHARRRGRPQLRRSGRRDRAPRDVRRAARSRASRRSPPRARPASP